MNNLDDLIKYAMYVAGTYRLLKLCYIIYKDTITLSNQPFCYSSVLPISEYV